MSLKSKSTAGKSFQDLSNSISDSERLRIETRLLMYRFLSEIDKVASKRGINRKELASLAGTSASYITQLYQGKKIINLQLLARIKKALDIDFKIEVIHGEIKAECSEEVTPKQKETGVLISKNKIPDKIGHIQDKIKSQPRPEII